MIILKRCFNDVANPAIEETLASSLLQDSCTFLCTQTFIIVRFFFYCYLHTSLPLRSCHLVSPFSTQHLTFLYSDLFTTTITVSSSFPFFIFMLILSLQSLQISAWVSKLSSLIFDNTSTLASQRFERVKLRKSVARHTARKLIPGMDLFSFIIS